MYDLPSVYDSKRCTARKQTNGKYKLFWTGTNNEIFPYTLFATAQAAKKYLAYLILKQSS